MTIEERRKMLSAKITEYFNAKSLSIVTPSETLIIGSKLNNMQDNAIMDESIEIHSKMQEISIVDEDPTYQRHVIPKKNYFGTRQEVVKKETRKKIKASPIVSNKMSQTEVTAILSKDRKHKLWDKEIYSWTAKDWEELYKLRDEK
jgi:hypothetical protein